ncbi:MAG: helix-turn-helix transcriptional regulator [Sphingobacterium sp.]
MDSVKNNSDRIILLLKTQGAMDVAAIADRLEISKEGTRQHLVRLLGSGLVEKSTFGCGVGRPCLHYTLSDTGQARFPDTHAEVTVQLLQSIKHLLGDNALGLLIGDREKQSYARYQKKLESATKLEEKLDRLTEVRCEEGYMAEWKKEGANYYFIENHCPICAAASVCQQFCRAELKNFKRLLGTEVYIERTQHILAGEQRCVYLIQEKAAHDPLS